MSYRCFVGFYLCELILQANSCTLSYWNTATTRLQKRYKWMYVFLKMQILAKCRISLQTNTGQHTTMVTTSNRSLYTLLLLFLAVATSCCYSGWSVSRVASGPRPIDCWCLHCRQWTIFTYVHFPLVSHAGWETWLLGTCHAAVFQAAGRVNIGYLTNCFHFTTPQSISH